MEPWAPTTSNDSRTSRRSSYVFGLGLSAASYTPSSTPPNRKGSFAEADTVRAISGTGHLSMPPPSKLNSRYPASMSTQRRPSSSLSQVSFTSDQSIDIDTFHLPANMASSLPNSSAIDDSGSTETTPTLEAKQKDNFSPSASLPDPALQGTRGEPDLESNRMSFSSSVYQLGSVIYDRAKGAMTASTPSSVAGSEPDSEHTTSSLTV